MFSSTSLGRRRRLLSIIVGMPLAIVSFTACASSSVKTSQGSGDCPKMYDVTYQSYPGSLVNIWAAVADKEGFFAKHCLTATAVPVAGGPAALAQAASGQLDFVKSTPDNLVAASASGMKVKIVADSSVLGSFAMVVSPRFAKPGDSLQQVTKNLKGQKVGVNQLGGSLYYYMRDNFSSVGQNPDSVKYVGLGTQSAILSALEQGTVAAVEVDTVNIDVAAALTHGVVIADTRLASSGSDPAGAPEALQMLNGAGSTWAATDAFIAKNSDVVKRFVDATNEADAWVLDKGNRQNLYTLLENEKLGLAPAELPNADELFKHAVDLAADGTNGQPNIDEVALKNWIAWAAEARGIKNPPSVEDIVWTG